MTNDELYALWAPWRSGYILGPKPAACVFCEKAQAPAARDRDNLVLSDARARAVARVLTRSFHVPPENLVAMVEVLKSQKGSSRGT